VIGAAAEKGGPSLIREFDGDSGVGCLPGNASLTESPGGDLSTLIVVSGHGTIHKQHH